VLAGVLVSAMTLALNPDSAFAQMPAQAPLPMGSQPATAVEGATTLALIGPTNQSVVLQSTLQAMPHQTAALEGPHTHATDNYSGVPLLTLLAQVGAPTGQDLHGKSLSDYIVATGADGYKAVIALAEIEPDFHAGQVLVADSVNGKPLDVQAGPYRLIVTADKRPARCVRNLVKLELKEAP
jgi:hypothetical protein